MFSPFATAIICILIFILLFSYLGLAEFLTELVGAGTGFFFFLIAFPLFVIMAYYHCKEREAPPREHKTASESTQIEYDLRKLACDDRAAFNKLAGRTVTYIGDSATSYNKINQALLEMSIRDKWIFRAGYTPETRYSVEMYNRALENIAETDRRKAWVERSLHGAECENIFPMDYKTEAIYNGAVENEMLERENAKRAELGLKKINRLKKLDSIRWLPDGEEKRRLNNLVGRTIDYNSKMACMIAFREVAILEDWEKEYDLRVYWLYHEFDETSSKNKRRALAYIAETKKRWVWRERCPHGNEFTDVFPMDYDTEEEYQAAVSERQVQSDYGYCPTVTPM
jgi:hypothetical protein